MVALVQRVREASVTVEESVVGAIGAGLLVLLGVHRTDTEAEAAWLARKVAALRIFPDDAGRMNRSLLDVLSLLDVPGAARGGQTGEKHTGEEPAGALVVSQFTLYGTLRKGTRPSYSEAAGPAFAEPLYEHFVRELEAHLGQPVPTGMFGAEMDVALVNDGPVTLWLERRVG